MADNDQLRDLFGGSDSESDGPAGSSPGEEEEGAAQGARASSGRAGFHDPFGSEDDDDDAEEADEDVGEGKSGGAASEGEAGEEGPAAAPRGRRSVEEELFGSDDDDDDDDGGAAGAGVGGRSRSRSRSRSPAGGGSSSPPPPARAPPIDVVAPLVDAPDARSLLLARLGNALRVAHREFDPDTFGRSRDPDDLAETGADPEQAEDGSVDAGAAAREALTVRWRYESLPGGGWARASNARFVRWSDGSVQLLVGDEALDVVVANEDLAAGRAAGAGSAAGAGPAAAGIFAGLAPQTAPAAAGASARREPSAHLFAHLPTLIQGQGPLQAKLAFRPTSLSARAQRGLAAQVDRAGARAARIRTTVTTADPARQKREREADMERTIRERERIAERLARAAARAAGAGRAAVRGGQWGAGQYDAYGDGGARAGRGSRAFPLAYLEEGDEMDSEEEADADFVVSEEEEDEGPRGGRRRASARSDDGEDDGGAHAAHHRTEEEEREAERRLAAAKEPRAGGGGGGGRRRAILDSDSE